jgi:hypothetical protein
MMARPTKNSMTTAMTVEASGIGTPIWEKYPTVPPNPTNFSQPKMTKRSIRRMRLINRRPSLAVSAPNVCVVMGTPCSVLALPQTYPHEL